MKYLFIGYVVPEDDIRNYPAVSPIGNNLQLGFLKEMYRYVGDNLEILSFLPINTFPKSARLRCKRSTMNLKFNAQMETIPYINLSVLKYITVMFNTFILLIQKFVRTKEKTIIMTYHVSVFFSLPLFIVTKLNHNLIPVCLVTDSPDDYFKRNNYVKDWLRLVSNFYRKMLLKKYHAFITINEYILKSLEISKPFIVFFPSVNYTPAIRTSPENLQFPIKITYTGSLAEHYSIREIVKLAEKMGSRYEFHIYGKGDMAKEIQNLKISNFIYHGYLNNNKVSQIQKQSDLLLCLLKSSSYQGRYAFPGKIIEYIFSGTPIISFPTPSIPSILKSYINIVEDETVAGLEKQIHEICDDISQYKIFFEKATRGQEYVSEHLNWSFQTKQILHFLKSIT